MLKRHERPTDDADHPIDLVGHDAVVSYKVSGTFEQEKDKKNIWGEI